MVPSIALCSPDLFVGDAASVYARRWKDDSNGGDSSSLFLHRDRKTYCGGSSKALRRIKPGIGSGSLSARATSTGGGSEVGSDNGMLSDQNVEKDNNDSVADAMDNDVGRSTKSGEGGKIFNL